MTTLLELFLTEEVRRTRTAPTAFTIEYKVGTAIGTNAFGRMAGSLRVLVRNGIIQTALPF